MSHRLPTTNEIRERIEGIEDNDYRMAHKYQYLIAGRESEVVGKYRPTGTDARLTTFNGVESVLFAVKSAKHRGRLRPCAVPLESKYEPWTKEVYNYMKGKQDPFDFESFSHYYKGSGWSDNTRVWYLAKVSKEAFKGLMWSLKGYHNTPQRWRSATNHVIRKARTLDLRFKYRFDSLDLATFGGWKSSSADQRVPAAVEHYLYLDLGAVESNFDILKGLAESYFYKLCKEDEKP